MCMTMRLRVLADRFTVVRLEAGETAPAWAFSGSFYSVTGTARELSVVCESRLVPAEAKCELGWRALEVQGPLQFDQVGILASLSQVLAERGISIFAVSTFDTDYILLKHANLEDAVKALVASGHTVLA